MIHQDDPDYPDTGLDPTRMYDDGEKRWWQLPMHSFTGQVRKHCHECSVPLRGYGELSQAPDSVGVEYVSATHAEAYRLKRPRRTLVLVTDRQQLGAPLGKVTDYLQNARR